MSEEIQFTDLPVYEQRLFMILAMFTAISKLTKIDMGPDYSLLSDISDLKRRMVNSMSIKFNLEGTVSDIISHRNSQIEETSSIVTKLIWIYMLNRPVPR